MRRLPRLFATLALVTGCATTAQNDAANIRVTRNDLEVKDCKFLGHVQGDDQLNGGPVGRATAENDRAVNTTVYMRNKASAMGANTILLVSSAVSSSRGDQYGEAYSCVATPTAASASADAEPQSPTAKVHVVATESEVRGCTFIDSIDESIACPAAYAEQVPCMTFRAAKQGGNTLLASGSGKVYRCGAGR